ncbi:MAG: rod shape-determining protein [Ruminococcus sp.]|jgi:rod shape-determining protein MreB|nr:rod shape-determining protein [Ruminococcus sp.]
MDIGIDLGTVNIMITMSGRGIVLNEPSCIAYNKKTTEIIAVGHEAYRMEGRTPDYITVIRPMEDGVISDHSMTENMITHFIEKVTGRQLLMPDIIMCVPSSITDVENRAVIEAAKNAGAKKVWLLEEPLAALIGAGADISRPDGNMVIDLGGGTTDIAVVSMNGIVVRKSVRVAGNKLDKAIVKYLSNRYKLLVGEKTAEAAKLAITNLFQPDGTKRMVVKGRHLIRGLPEKIEISDFDIYEAIIDTVSDIVFCAKSVLENTPPELISNIFDNGIYLTGGGALLGGLPEYLSTELNVKCVIAKDPLDCVANGAMAAFSKIDTLLDGFEYISMLK